MTNEQILTGAIEKAVSNGWDQGRQWLTHTYKLPNTPEGTRQVIFDLDFAKAFWGEKWPNNNKMNLMTRLTPSEKAANDFVSLEGYGHEPDYKGSCYQYHLQRMVLEENPLRYIERFLDD